ncbi:actin-related protein [Fomitiporia mediterranea MF3/22]|uniref:actin-related protein n=1 Tax=Fomitiporia mediterranea (strain MF3/22) TaxID=694068 RepID=UPI000440785E|nr:actin-related protein [Fomitiporia mediterranea MF3/22]EJD07496.1 actin-related protein [Fomitiporia mediterranea MF3/22]
MSNIAFRDSSVVIIETGCTAIRAIRGLAELIERPTVEVEARVGLRRTNEENGFGNGQSSTSKAHSQPKVNDYLVGRQLDEALAAGMDVVVSWPFEDGGIKDYVAAEALWKYVLFNQLGLKRTQNESPAILTFPHGLSRDTYERICQIFFERFNMAALSILERPLSQLYAANSLNGIVIDIGHHRTDVVPIYECAVQHNCSDHTPIGLADCEAYLASLLRNNEQLVSTLSPPEAPLTDEELQTQLLALVRQIWHEGHVKLGEAEVASEEEGVTNIAAVLVAGKEKAVIESNQKKRATQKASAAEQARAREIEALDLITIDFRDKQVTVGRERHRLLDPLFDPTRLRGVNGSDGKTWRGGDLIPLQDICGYAVAKADLDARVSIWEGLFVTGDCASLVKGIGHALQTRLEHFILGNPDHQNDAQPKQIRVLHVPEYFANYREKGDGLAAFLGASIVAKIIFSDPNSKNFVSKGDYGSKGPKAIIEMSASLL